VTQYTLRRLTPADREVVTALLVREWGAVTVVALSLGGAVDASTLPGWLAESDGEVVGLLTYTVRDGVAELVTINAFTGGGVGSALLNALVEECRARDVRRCGSARSTRQEGSNRKFRHTAWTAFPSATRSN
jgi:GNAT superfamily N-acetyltransferase